MPTTKIHWGQIFVVLSIVLVSLCAATQWTAWRLGFLIAQSLNQIEKAYGANNSILDNCHVRVSFATNDERTAKRVLDALGMATEIRAMKNYAGHRLSPWLGHLMVSRSETARPLLTPGEIMQLPPDDEIVMVAGTRPIRAKKARYYQDEDLMKRILTPQDPVKEPFSGRELDAWLKCRAEPSSLLEAAPKYDESEKTKTDEGGHDRQQEFDEGAHMEEGADRKEPQNEFEVVTAEADHSARKVRDLNNQMRSLTRQTDLDQGNPSNL